MYYALGICTVADTQSDALRLELGTAGVLVSMWWDDRPPLPAASVGQSLSDTTDKEVLKRTET